LTKSASWVSEVTSISIFVSASRVVRVAFSRYTVLHHCVSSLHTSARMSRLDMLVIRALPFMIWFTILSLPSPTRLSELMTSVTSPSSVGSNPKMRMARCVFVRVCSRYSLVTSLFLRGLFLMRARGSLPVRVRKRVFFALASLAPRTRS
jgi:hypothetical protein